MSNIWSYDNFSSRVIWLGDLNYRIALSYHETKKLLEQNDWDALLSKDQVLPYVSSVLFQSFIYLIIFCDGNCEDHVTR